MMLHKAYNVVLLRSIDKFSMMGKELSGRFCYENMYATLNGVHADWEVSA